MKRKISSIKILSIKISSIIMALVICLSLLPTSAFAAETEIDPETGITIIRRHVYDGQPQNVTLNLKTNTGFEFVQGTHYDVQYDTDDFTNVGKIKATLVDLPNGPYFNGATFLIIIDPAPLAITGLGGSHTKEYDGTSDCDGQGLAVQFTGKIGNDDVSIKPVDAVYSYDDFNAGDNRTIRLQANSYTLDGAAASNYYVSENVPNELTASGTITKGTYTGKTQDSTGNLPGCSGSFDLSSLLPDGATAGPASIASGDIFDGTPTVSGQSLSYQLKEDAAFGSTGSVTIPVTNSTNYKDFFLTITVAVKHMPVLTVSDITVPYSGEPVSADAISAACTATVDGQNIDGTWSFDGQAPVNVADSGTKTILFTPQDTDQYATATATVLVTIEKAAVSLTLTAAPASLTNGGSVTLTLSGLPAGGAAAVTCDNDIAVTPEAGGVWTAALPSSSQTYTFTAEYAGDPNHAAAATTCTVKVSTSGSGSSGSSSNGGSASTAYPPTVAQPSEGGSVTVSPSRPARGDKVTITPAPADGYEAGKVTVTDRNGKPVTVTKNADGTYTFVQPSGAVKIDVSYRPVESENPVEPTNPVEPANPAEPAWNNPFTDLPKNTWYYDAVQYVQKNGLMSGYSNGAFGPDERLSRAMLAQILYNKAGKPNMNDSNNSSVFSDVPGDAWCAGAVSWAAQNGIVSGYGNGTFGPNDPITREQLAVMLWRYAGSPAASGTLDSFLDGFTDAVSVSAYALDAMRWAVEKGIINGVGGGALAPDGQATRAQAAQMLMNFMENHAVE